MIEKVIFYILAFVIFIIIFGKLIKRNDTVYVYLLFLEFLGIGIRFVDVINKVSLPPAIVIIIYIISIILPLLVILLERKKIFLSEAICMLETNILLKLGKNDQARKKLINLINKHPNSYYAHKLLAKIYEKECKYEEAIDEYVRAVELNTQDYDSYYQIAFLLNQTEKQVESENMLRDLLSKKPDYYKASELLGTILYDQEKFKEAVNVLSEALKYNPERYELYYGLGMAFTRLNDFSTAKEYYEKAAMLNSMLFHARVSIAQIVLIAGELEEAESRFTECLQDKDSEPAAYYYLAIISLLKGEKDRAVGYVNISIELDKRMYKKVCKNDIFLPIIDQVRNVQDRTHRYHLTYQEIKTRKHLEDTFLLVQKLKSNGQIDKKDDVKSKKIEEIEQQREY